MNKTHLPPTELRVTNSGKLLQVTFNEETSFELPAELLRVESPSAEVQGHSSAEKRTIGSKVNVAITNIEPVGNYAVRITFDDGHDTGLFTWEYLAILGEKQEEIWTTYLTRLAQLGLSRDPA